MYSKDFCIKEDPTKGIAVKNACKELCIMFNVEFEYCVKKNGFGNPIGEYVKLDDDTLDVTGTAVEMIRLEVAEWIVEHAPYFSQSMGYDRMKRFIREQNNGTH